MTKQFLLLIFMGILLTGCFTQEEKYEPYIQSEHMAHVQDEYAFHVPEGEFATIAPENLCPFTVDVYPNVLHVGDPLYVRLNFRNNTGQDTYAYARRIDSMEIDHSLVEFHLKDFSGVIPWAVSHMGEGFMSTVWQKIVPGEKGLTQYQSIGFPGRRTPGMPPFFGSVRNYDAQWRDIKTGGVSGQLVVIVNNQTRMQRYDPQSLRTIASISSLFVIKPRKQEEATLLEAIDILEAIDRKDRIALEQIIPKLTSGTLQNLLKYQLLLWELKDDLHGEAKLSESQVLKEIEQIESFLEPLHEIERENLKRLADSFLVGGSGKEWIESRMNDYGELPLKRFIEVFGVPVCACPTIVREAKNDATESEIEAESQSDPAEMGANRE